MIRVAHTHAGFDDASRAQIAELERLFDCRVEIGCGVACVSSVHYGDCVQKRDRPIDPICGIVPDSETPWASEPVAESTHIGATVLHSQVFMGRLRFSGGTATSWICPAPTPIGCVDFLTYMSSLPVHADLWRDQGASL